MPTGKLWARMVLSALAAMWLVVRSSRWPSLPPGMVLAFKVCLVASAGEYANHVAVSSLS